jgi:hypothetical protein
MARARATIEFIPERVANVTETVVHETAALIDRLLQLPDESATRRESGPIRLNSDWRLNSDAIIDGPAQPLLAASR